VQVERAFKKSTVFSYQAVFSRNTTQVCIANSGVIAFTNTTTTVPFDQSNLTTCAKRTGGPVIIIGKTTLARVEADSFDGNHDGFDDVQEALNHFAASQTAAQQATNKKKKKAKVTESSLVSKFLLAVRNRATVNGGSIGLKSIVVTGRQATKTAPFATFGGSTNRILISPCFPVERPHLDDPRPQNNFANYTFEFVGVASGWNGVFDVQPTPGASVTYDTFVATHGATTADDVMATQTASFPLVMGAFPNPNTAVGGTVQPGVVLGSVSFQRCTAFSYFQ